MRSVVGQLPSVGLCVERGSRRCLRRQYEKTLNSISLRLALIYLGAPLEIRGTLPRDLSGVGVKAKVELTLP